MPDNIPQVKILNRDDVIILSDDVCNCGRTKIRPHCPVCGSVQTYTQSQRFPEKMEDGTVLKGCRRYRCIPCGTKYNDIDWYFNCAARAQISESESEADRLHKKRTENLKIWGMRILKGEKFDRNDETSFKSQCGGSLLDYRRYLLDNSTVRRAKEAIDNIAHQTVYPPVDDTKSVKDETFDPNEYFKGDKS